MKKFLVVCFGILVGFESISQSTDFPLNHPVYQNIEMVDAGNEEGFSTTIKPYSRKTAYEFLNLNKGSFLSMEMREYSKDSTRSTNPILKKLYQYPADLFYYKDDRITEFCNAILKENINIK